VTSLCFKWKLGEAFRLPARLYPKTVVVWVHVCKKQNQCVDVVQELLLTISWHYEDCNSTMKAKYIQMERPRDSSLVT
jgi:hypothetical protein